MNASMPKLVPCSSILTLLCFFCSRPLLTPTGGMSRRAILHYEGSFRSSPRMQPREIANSTDCYGKSISKFHSDRVPKWGYAGPDRKRDLTGKSVSVRVDLGGSTPTQNKT